MMQEPIIENLRETLLAGLAIETTLQKNETQQLWQQFMPRRKEIAQLLNGDLYAVHEYNSDITFDSFTPQTVFTKWAAAPVSRAETLPSGINALILPAGLYARFMHKGPASTFQATLNYIFQQWLPRSGYSIANRPHFEVMREGYKGHLHPDAEEEVWVPVEPGSNNTS